MAIITFKGFGGVQLQAEVAGHESDPAILLVHGAGQTREVWSTVVDALVQSGRQVIRLDLRGHGRSDWPADGNYSLHAYAEDLRAVLSQLSVRPVVVAATVGGWIATSALSSDAANLAAGLVLIDMPIGSASEAARQIAGSLPDVGDWDPRVVGAMELDLVADALLNAGPKLNLPIMVMRGGISWVRQSPGASQFDGSLADAEFVEVDDEDLLLVTDRTEALLSHLLDFLEHKQPRSAREFRAGSDARTLRDAMGCFATGVTIVTARGLDGAPIGLTANSFTSVSLDPPLLLVSISNPAGSAPSLQQASRFAINVLQIGQQQASNRFASKGEDRFVAMPWRQGESGVPLLDGSLGCFECKRHAVHHAGDHFILIGEVVRAQYEPRRDPLLYFRGKYRRLHMA